MAERRKRKERTSALVKRDGALCLTFVNTTAEKRQPLGDYAGLVVWGRRHGALTAAEADHLGPIAVERPDEAAAAVGAAEELRVLLSRIFNCLADHEEPPTDAIEALSGYLIHTVPPQRLVPYEGGIALDWAAGREADLGRPLWRVVLSAMAVLTSKDYGRIVRCSSEKCGLLFVARSSGPPRKWCQRSCGQRIASLRHYHEKVKPYKAQVKKDVRERLFGRTGSKRG